MSVDTDRELTVSLDASATRATPGDSLTFSVVATGRGLFGLIIEFGDLLADSVDLPGATTATVRFDHAYDAPGTYTVRAIAEELTGNSARDSLTVEIQP